MSSDLILTLRGRGERCFGGEDQLWVSRGGVEPPVSVCAEAVAPGDYVAIQYGFDWPTAAPPLPQLPQRAPYGTEKVITVPTHLTDELALFLGAYLSEGHCNRSNWTVVITNSVDDVLVKVQNACVSVFGLPGRIVRQTGKCPGFVVSSKRVVEFLDGLGCGSRASDKQVPPLVYSATRSVALCFMQGVALDAYTTHRWAGKWGICLESRQAINQLQDLMTMLGVVNGQVPKFNKTMQKTYYELYAAGPWGQEMVRLVPFLEPDKSARAAEYLKRRYRTGATDLIPGVTGAELYSLVPRGRAGRRGRGSGRQALRHLRDPRTTKVTRASVMKVQAAGAVLPVWLGDVIDRQTRFVEVVAHSLIGQGSGGGVIQGSASV